MMGTQKVWVLSHLPRLVSLIKLISDLTSRLAVDIALVDKDRDVSPFGIGYRSILVGVWFSLHILMRVCDRFEVVAGP